ncbi:ArsR family transcriptional regulator [Candidatus Bathyarchaeota archaeon]|nr:ArsR family transcriptional regulator [Candidatus Bathyarchaeota archaeon]
MSKLWAVQPLHTSIVEILLKKRGSSTDTDLLSSLKKSYGELSLRELNKTLMRLEVDGIIHVSTLTKNKKRVEIRKI